MGNPHADELHKQRSFYMEAMALADRALTEWFFHRLGVDSEEVDTFARLMQAGNLSGRIEVFKALGDSLVHKQVAEGLSEANVYRNRLAHGQLFPAPDPNSSFPEIGEEWVIETYRRKGPVTEPVTAADIEQKRKALVDVLNKLTRLTINLPVH